jgi:hypothetical protein
MEHMYTQNKQKETKIKLFSQTKSEWHRLLFTTISKIKTEKIPGINCDVLVLVSDITEKESLHNFQILLNDILRTVGQRLWTILPILMTDNCEQNFLF